MLTEKDMQWLAHNLATKEDLQRVEEGRDELRQKVVSLEKTQTKMFNLPEGISGRLDNKDLEDSVIKTQITKHRQTIDLLEDKAGITPTYK